jgi:hypothetical protein
MSSLAGGLGNVVGQAAGLSKSAGLLQELVGQSGRAQILRPGYGCILQFDACINEQHGRDAQVTTNPVEDGSVVSDHIVVQPVNVMVTGVVSDTPLYDAKRFLTQSIGNAVSSLVPPLGVIAAATAYQLTHPQDSAFSPSKEAYRALMQLAAGDPTASPPTLPAPFTMLTAYARYPNMVVKSLQMPRDASTSGVCVFTLQLEQIQLVTPQYVNVAYIENKPLGASKKIKGEQEAQASETGANFNAGRQYIYEPTKAAETKLANTVGKGFSAIGLGD